MKTSILYLDDEADCLGVFRATYHNEYDVRTAFDAEEARRMLRERAADIIISDQQMPDIKGTEFLREMAAIYPKSFRVLLTGNSMVGDVIYELGAGILHLFIAKPWTRESMNRALERANATTE